MDDLTGRHHHVVLLEAGQVVAAQLVIDRAVRRDQNLYARRIEDIERDHNAAIITLFEDVGVPV